MYFEISGAFTGETSAGVVQSMGGSICLLGHSERRALFAETNGDVAQKLKLIQCLEMTPVLCLGESLEERQEGKTYEILATQLKEGACHADWSKPILLAYEPVWAIGTGKVATPLEAEEAHQFLRKQVHIFAGADVAEQIHILYGGSVKPANSRDLWAKENIDGFLVGGASLEVESFVDIYRKTMR